MLLIRVQHVNRILINSVLMLISFLLLAFSLSDLDKINGFYYCISASMLHGFSQALGEVTLMGYLKAFPSDLVMTFGSGTGLSGFADIFTILFLQSLGVTKGKAFLILGICVFPYCFSFLWVDDKRKTYSKDYQIYPELQLNSPPKAKGKTNLFEIVKEDSPGRNSNPP